MDHNEAIQMQAAEKYILGELPAVLRDEYEEHFFDCAECALDVKAAAVFSDTAREALRQEKASSLSKDPIPARGGWLRWFQPLVAVPAFAALLLVVGYQNLVSIPHWKGLAAQSSQAHAQATPTTASATAPRVLPIFSLLGASRRGGGRPVFHAKPGESFALRIDITDPNPSLSSSYELRLEEASGAAHLLGIVSHEEARNSVFVEVPAGFPAGNVRLVVIGKPQPGAERQTDREIASISFVVEFGPDFEHHQ